MSLSKKIRYANYVVSRKDLEAVLATDPVYQAAIARAQKAREDEGRAEAEREEISNTSNTALPEEREASRLERAVVHTQRRLKELRQQRDRQRVIANKARVRANQVAKRRIASVNVSLRRCHGERREALDTAEDRKTHLYQKLYAENYRETLNKAGLLGDETPGEGEEEVNDENLGLLPPDEEEEQDG